jgi:hypothetical protein
MHGDHCLRFWAPHHLVEVCRNKSVDSMKQLMGLLETDERPTRHHVWCPTTHVSCTDMKTHIRHTKTPVAWHKPACWTLHSQAHL